ncbi:hypothetical protein R50072_16040 [Simiduia litorea]|uniref:DUF2835 family protein n=1 Tax=Simiduia litorea TaxID=1435348 RepID=UPI0036F27D19
MTFIDVDLTIEKDELLRLYRGSARIVSARAIDGRRIQFPAQALRAFVKENGVNGRFRIEFDHAFKLVSIKAL